MSLHAQRIVGAARAYLGVPFRHQGRSTHGLDCLGLLVRVADDCGLTHGHRALSRFDDTHYGHLPEPVSLKTGLAKLLEPIETQAMQAGDIVLCRIDGQARHLGIIGDYPLSYPPAQQYSLIHAYAPARRVVEHRLDDEWILRIDSCWRYLDA